MVLFLASKAACSSPFVQQELGAALITKKQLVPIVWDMSPADLPGWIKNYQALNLNGATAEKVKAQMTAISTKIKSDKENGILVAGLLFAGLLFLGTQSKK